MDFDLAALAPEITVASAACLVLLVDLVLRGRSRVFGGWMALFSLAFAFVMLPTAAAGGTRTTLAGMFVLDPFSLVLKAIFLVAAAYVVWIAMPPMRGHRYEGEFYFLFLCSVLGTMLMPSSRDLLMLFVALELVSAPAFVMAGLRKLNPRSNEAAIKFFLFGVFSVGLLVYGISLVYGFTGTTTLVGISQAIAGQEVQPLLLIGVLFIVLAFAFKVSAVPVHFWAPDTYEGSPTPLAAFLSVASKGAGFVGLLLILLVAFPGVSDLWGPLVAAMAIATMTVGNVVALRQRQIVRLLAYSSIGHAGYMLIPIAIIGPHTGVLEGANAELVRALVVYLAVYAAMNLGAFAVVIGISKQYPTLLVRDLSGLGRRAPLPAMAMAVFLVSLGGIPPLAGWFAKFAVFTAALGVGTTMAIVLAATMVVNSVISLYYYMGVVRVMYLTEPEDQTPMSFPPSIALAAGVAMLVVLVLGVYPEPFAQLGDLARIAFLPTGGQ